MSKGILIVDDASFVRTMIKNILTKNGFDVIDEAENGAEAIEKYKKLQPELIIMDIIMPEIDGIQATGEIKKLNPDAKIIMCSAIGQRGMMDEAMQAGAEDFIVKPFEAARLIEAVKKMLG
ncbi:MAG TPA: response regulator [Clostridia bacterium]|nr:response regulator [Clostridia bacterium]